MASFLFTVSSLLFFFLGLLFFTAMALFYGEGRMWAEWWLHVGDLPLLLTGGIAGSVTLYQSLTNMQSNPFRTAVMGSATVLSLFFLVILNFWSIVSP